MTSTHGTFCTFSFNIMLIKIAGEGCCRKPQEARQWGTERPTNLRSPTDNTVWRGVSFSPTHDAQRSHFLSSINWNSFNPAKPPDESVLCRQRFSLNPENSCWPQVTLVTRREEEEERTTQQHQSWSCYLLFTDFQYGLEFTHYV